MTSGVCLSEDFRSELRADVNVGVLECSSLEAQELLRFISVTNQNDNCDKKYIHLQINSMIERLVVTFRIKSAVWRFNCVQRP